jgi:enoyl-CoA hydratase
MENDPILEEVEDRVAYVTLNRAHALNAMSYEMMQRLEETILKLSNEKNLSAIVIKAAGRAFCTGADLKFLLSIIDRIEEIEKYIGQIGKALNSIENCPIPVVAVVQDYALAGGFELLQACDIIIAAETARLGDQHSNYWMIPGAGGTQRLGFLIGLYKAKELLFTGRWLTGKEAEQLGFVYRAVPIQNVESCLEELLKNLLEKSPITLNKMKELIHYNFKPMIRKGLEFEKSVFFKYIQSPTALEGLKAFVERRKPQYKKIEA